LGGAFAVAFATAELTEDDMLKWDVVDHEDKVKWL
jgi:hypothetical protein